jgi:hypothetical protein
MTSSAEQQGEIGAAAPEAGEFDALMQANIARVFNERDPDRRRIALSELYSDGAILYDPETVATGWGAISQAVEDLLQRLPRDSCSPRPDPPWATTAPRGCSGARVRLMAPWPRPGLTSPILRTGVSSCSTSSLILAPTRHGTLRWNT